MVQPGLQHDVEFEIVAVDVEVRVLVHVPAARPVAALAGGAEVQPGGVVAVFARPEALYLVADVAAEAVLVPKLHRDDPLALVRSRDLEVMEPLAPEDVPGRGQHDDPAVLKRRQVVLDAPVPQGVVHLVLHRFAGEEGLGDEVPGPDPPDPVVLAAEGESLLREVAPYLARAGRLHHLRVAGGDPVLVRLFMTEDALTGPDHHRRLLGQGRPHRLFHLGRGSRTRRGARGGGEESERGQRGGRRTRKGEPHDGGSSTRSTCRISGASISLRAPEGQTTRAETPRPTGPRPKTAASWFWEA